MESVIVTGAGKGIGASITERLLQDGFFVHACDIDEKSLAKLKNNFKENLETHALDVSDYKQVEAFFDTFGNDNRPQYLVNNAGIYPGKDLFDYSAEEIETVYKVNLFSATYFTKFFAKPLVENKVMGAIVNMASVADYGGSDAIYGSSKGALAALTRSCALNLSPYIRVNAIAPGIVHTELLNNLPEHVLKLYRGNELIKEPIHAEDIAATVSFLFSADAKHYTGATFDLNNGFHRR